MEGYYIFTWLVIIYAVCYTVSKIFFSIVSIIQVKLYTKKYPHIATETELEDHARLNQHQLPVITIVSPAFNEAKSIVESVSSFLAQTYKHTEVIISSDGGSDGTLEILKTYFNLFETHEEFKTSPHITHKQVRAYYRSATHKNLVVIDKENGGKADAQNAGIAIAKGEIVTIIDSDSILETNALIHLADIFERDQKTVGIGTPIGVVNDSNVGPDGVEDASFPKSFWAKIQVLEYLRSFLLGRMAMQKFRGLMIVSGAFGVYQKWILEAVNGYSPGSLAEDMDVDCKIWRFLDFNKLDFDIKYIPEVFCWSQVPDDFKNLKSQRDRWSRGLTETIWKNKDLFFNFRFKLLGLFSYPYYVLFEWLTPFIEVGGIIYLIIALISGNVETAYFVHFAIGYYIVGLSMNFFTIFIEVNTGGHYKSSASLRKLFLVALIEPIFYHWINSFLYISGNINLLLGTSKGWGEMSRSGFTSKDQEIKAAA